MSLRAFPAGALDENPPHCLGGSREKMGASVPFLILVANQSKSGFMDQRSGLKGMSGSLLGHFGGGQSPQLIIDQRQQFLGGLRIALLSRLEDTRNVAHASHFKPGLLADNPKKRS